MLTSLHLHEEGREVCIKARSSPPSLAVIGQVTKHATVKWPIARHRATELIPVHSLPIQLKNTQAPRDEALTCKSEDVISFSCIVHLICILCFRSSWSLEVFTLRRKKASKQMYADAVKAVSIKGIVEYVSLENLIWTNHSIPGFILLRRLNEKLRTVKLWEIARVNSK